MTEKTVAPTLALLVSISLSIILTAFASDRPQVRAAMGLAGEVVDAALSERVEAALRSDPGLFGADLTVTTREGSVDLGGSVPDGRTLERALDLAGNVRGVREVRSSMVIEPPR